MKCASITITSSSTSVRVRDDFQVHLWEMDPKCCGPSFKNIYVKVALPDGRREMLATYDKEYQMFDPEYATIQSIYQGRFYVDENTLILDSVKFDDEGTRFIVEYYYDRSSNLFTSTYVEIKTVYGM